MNDTTTERRALKERLQLAEFARAHFVFTASVGTTVEHLRTPAFWAKVADKFKPFDRLEVRCEDGSYFCEFLIRHASADGVELEPLSGAYLGDVGVVGKLEPLAAGLRVSYEGLHKKWTAWSGTAVLRDGFATEADARLWLTSYDEMLKRSARGAAA
jgi:hypothetical protein